MGYPGDALSRPPIGRSRHDRPATAEGPPRFDWVPIRSLSERHRDRIRQHLLALPEHDRYLRFGFAASDEQVEKYVESLDFGRDEVFGVFNRRLLLVAMAHLAFDPAPQRADKPAMAEFGVSVLPSHRGRGFGARLFDRAVLHARNRGIETLFIHALSENAAMLRIARNAGATVEPDGSESEAWLKLPPDTVASHVEQLVEQTASEIDYRLKVQARLLDRWKDAVNEVTANIGGVRNAPKD